MSRVGLNRSTGPELMREPVHYLAQHAPHPISRSIFRTAGRVWTSVPDGAGIAIIARIRMWRRSKHRVLALSWILRRTLRPV